MPTTPMTPTEIRAALDADQPIRLGCTCDGRPGHTDSCLRERLDRLMEAYADDLIEAGLILYDGRT